VIALGGPADLVDRPERQLPSAPVRLPVASERAGFIVAMDVRALGLAVLSLGGGRSRPEDRIDHGVGLADVRGLGERVERGQPLTVIHARDDAGAARAAAAVRAAVAIADAPAPAGPVILDRIAGPRR